MALMLEIECLSGVSFAAVGPEAEIPDWPPQPDRVFSALVAAWAARGEDDDERHALEWLEEREPPYIDASEVTHRSAPVVFVPPNDPRGDRKATATQVLPEGRRRQPRRFPAARPYDPIVRLCWDRTDADRATLSALDAVARDVAYVGHSSTLTRCRFVAPAGELEVRNASVRPRRRVYGGRLAELLRDHEAGRRPGSGAPAGAVTATPEERHNTFGARWLILEHVGGVMPDVRAAPLVARTIRDTILSGYGRTGMGGEIPEIVSGHTPRGGPSRDPHIAVVPLPFAGFAHADGHVMGFAIIPPHPGAILDDADFRRALRAIAPMDQHRHRRIMTVQTKEGTPRDAAFAIQLSPTFEAPFNRRSLDPRLYVGPSKAYATVTPIVLDRHLKARDEARDAEIRQQLVRSCHNVGVPEPEVVSADKHPVFEGVPSAYPSGNAPAWTRWRLHRSFASRQLTHAFLRFSVDVPGPLLIGAGRHFGLGLCRPVSS